MNDAASPAFVVAVSASGGRTASLQQFLQGVGLGEDIAVVVVVQSREALDEAALKDGLRAVSREISPVEDGAPIEAGRIYLPAADLIISIEDGVFRTQPAEQDPGERGTIDSFLVSLAHDEERRAIAVALAGTTSAGTLGVKAIKVAGGIALAEETAETSPDELSKSSSPAALADDLLPIDGLVERVNSSIRYLGSGKGNGTDAEEDGSTKAALASIATVLRNKTGHDFHGYKEGTFLRRVQRRMQVLQMESIGDYVEAVRNRADEPQQLFNDLLIGVTQFFRDVREFDLLEREVIPKLVDGKTRDEQVRVWVVGCSTGEEAYSIAILLRERMASQYEVPHIQIFATDLDGRALAAARAGRYPEDIAKTLSPERLARWFVKEGNTYCVVKELREMCIFSQHSIIRDAPFSRLDLVSCRNLLIYLDTELQSRIIPLFHFALKPGGILFLGNSENVSRQSNLFSPIEARSRIFRREETGRRILPDFPFTAIDRRIVGTALLDERKRPVEGSLARRAERFVERHSPAYVIVDEDHQVLHFSGRMGRYIDPAGGAATLGIMQLIHPDLRLDVRSALTTAGDENRTVVAAGLRMGTNGHSLFVDLVVEPIREAAVSTPGYLVLFKDGMAPSDGSLAKWRDDEHEQQLEAELKATKDRLQTTVEELESTNEELKSSNEEYQSLNEELQSANEELETSKEELQSVNEELTTVNGELAHRVQDLTRATSDLKNFLESTQIATIFLDNDLKVTNFTPAVVEVFHLVESDTGRPIGHIKSRLAYDELQDDARRVLRTLVPVEREVGNPSIGARYLVRVLPYRSVDNFIAGVVITFVDITERQRAEEARRLSEERFRAIVESVRDYAIFTTDTDGRIDQWLPGAAAIFGWSAGEIVGQSASLLYTSEDIAQGAYNAELVTAKETGSAPDVRWHVHKDGRLVFIEGVAQSLRDSAGRLRGIIKIGQDVTERRRREEALRESESRAKLLLAELQHRVRNSLAVIRSIVRRTPRTGETIQQFTDDLEGRIGAFARVQAAVTRNPAAAIDLRDLLDGELQVAANKDGQVVRVDGPPLPLPAKAAETLALAIHELATNALKYGALSIPDGKLDIGWSVSGGDESLLDFRWRENGLTNLEPPTRMGFGTEILKRTLTYELRAESDLEYTPGGLHFSARIPMARLREIQIGQLAL